MHSSEPLPFINPQMIKRILNYYSSLPKTAVVGIFASIADIGALALMVQFMEMTPQQANVPSLVVGSLVQFVGNRYFSFSGAEQEQVHRQAFGFFFAELIALALNAALFHALVTYSPIGYAIARPLGTFLVFVGFSYPAWKKVFSGR